MIRMFQFKNTFLCENPEKIDAEYCVIGYFDGLDMRTEFNMNSQDACKLLSDPLQYEFVKDDTQEMCDYFNIIGLRKGSDQDFWDVSDMPYIFISCIRLKNKTEKIQEIISKIEQKYQAVCYTTLDSSDLIICLKTTSYVAGYRAVEDYHNTVIESDPGNGIQKGFSVLALKQKVLNSISKSEKSIIQDESLCVILRGVIKKWERINEFIDNIKKSVSNNGNKLFCEAYGVLGSEDIMIVLKDVPSISWLSLYAENALMTHTAYKDAFYNIRTEIIVDFKAGESI